MKRTVYCVSDHTGVTAEAFAHSLMSRFGNVEARYVVRSFVSDGERMDQVVAEVKASAEAGERPLVFSTLTESTARDRLKDSGAFVLGLFDHFVNELAEELESQPSSDVGAFHGIRDLAKYQHRLDAVDFTLATDDGLVTKNYDMADVILIGVSRVGKTPTALFMAMHRGLFAANYPLADHELESTRLPATLDRHRERLFALTIDPIRLHQIRDKRRPDSTYASLPTCTYEVNAAEKMFRVERIPSINTTTQSIEEIAATIITMAGLNSDRAP
jgi:regulator of PEP synthase PpsR (kinase-PPPase family)